MKTLLSHVALHCDEDSSDKLYVIQVVRNDEPAGTTFTATGYYGRRTAATLKVANLYTGPSQFDAELAASKQEKTKRRKYGTYFATVTNLPSTAVKPGSSASGTTGAASGASTARPTSTPAPRTFTWVLASPVSPTKLELEDFLTNPRWCAQRKFDGERRPVRVSRAGIQGFNRDCRDASLTIEQQSQLGELLSRGDFNGGKISEMDGESLASGYKAFDLLSHKNERLATTSFLERYSILEELLSDCPDMLVPVAWTEQEKRNMLVQALSEDWEGLIFRDIDCGYGAEIFKYKLWATATCLVTEINAVRSVKIAIQNDAGEMEPVGNVTIPGKQDIPEVGSLIEVRYLYALPGGSLFQPTYLRKRTETTSVELRSNIRNAPPEKLGA